MVFNFNNGSFNVNRQNPFQNNSNRQNPFQTGNTTRVKKPRKEIGTPLSRALISILITIIFGAVYFYVELPAINIHASSFYTFIVLLCIVYIVCIIITAGFQGDTFRDYGKFVKKKCTVPLIIIIAVILVGIIGTIAGWKIFRAAAYRDLLTVEDGNFAEEVEEISYDQIPMLDSRSAKKLGNRKLGELADMVSQFEVADDYTQINYKGRPVRVTPLVYGDIIKWFNNRSEGLPAYLIIDMVTQNVDVVRLQDGIRYTTAEHFNRNLYRYLRFNYPTYMFDSPAFEIDDSGNPFWVCPRIVKTIGLFNGTDIAGAVLVNAITGETQYYDKEDVPQWVDHVFTASLIITQYDYHGTYINGFLNSLFGQRNVTITTDGYNYIAIGDDVYLYTGITSVVSDESNIGFILSNQRTKETRFYSIAGAEEYSAMGSAEGQVQQMKYSATFPLLLNISEQPTYFMALKDDAELVKMYAMVNVSQYQIVATGSTVAECESNYRVMLHNNKLIKDEEISVVSSETNNASGDITDIRSAVMDGNTVFFIQISGDKYYKCRAVDVPDAILLNIGDGIEIEYFVESEGDSNTPEISSLTKTHDAPKNNNTASEAEDISLEEVS